MASEATKLDILGSMHIYSKVMEVIEHHMPISHSPCSRRSKGPLPSCSSLRVGVNANARHSFMHCRLALTTSNARHHDDDDVGDDARVETRDRGKERSPLCRAGCPAPGPPRSSLGILDR